MTRLLVVRHGEAEGNREHRFIGQTDVPLTELGSQQVARLTQRLAGVEISRVVSSDLRRAADTVIPTAEALGLEVHYDERLREIANGEWANLVAADVEARWPDLWSRYRQGEDVERPGGESWTDVQVRAVQAIEELVAALDKDDTVLVGTHAGPALGILRWAIGAPPEGTVWGLPFGALHNTSISTISLPGPRLHTLNDTGHLEGSEGLFV
ncbi:MAG: histidine phosphatase family protein [Acidimicrobiia bacterium]|nr:histidine phosphatase family protein [Acidimicrobiia bacterium]